MQMFKLVTGYVFTLCWTHNNSISFAEDGLLAIILVGFVAFGIIGEPGADKTCPPGCNIVEGVQKNGGLESRRAYELFIL